MRCLWKFTMMFGACALSFTTSCHHAPLPDTGAKTALAQELAAAKREGIPTTPQELERPLPPSEQNAAPLYVKLTQMRKTAPLSQADSILDSSLKHFPPSASELAQMRQAVAHRADMFLLIHQAAARPKCVFDRNWSLGAALPLPEYASMRMDARCLQSESLLQLNDGKPFDAIKTENLSFSIARHACSDPTLIAALVGIALHTITLNGMERILLNAGQDAAVDDAVRQATEQYPPYYRLAPGLGGDAVMQSLWCDEVRKQGSGSLSLKDIFDGEPIPHGIEVPTDAKAFALFMDRNQMTSLHLLRKAYQASDKPYLQSIGVFRSINAEIDSNHSNPAYLMSRVFIPIFASVVVKQAIIQAKNDVVRSASAVLAWKAKHGAFPQTLQQAISPVPTDPFDGKPLRYRLEGQGFVLYSVGETGKFEGGSPTVKPKSSEAVFRYPLPAYLK